MDNYYDTVWNSIVLMIRTNMFLIHTNNTEWINCLCNIKQNITNEARYLSCNISVATGKM